MVGIQVLPTFCAQNIDNNQAPNFYLVWIFRTFSFSLLSIQMLLISILVKLNPGCKSGTNVMAIVGVVIEDKMVNFS